ncbi:hypothetical protein PDJAM_G00236870 [Pangasius djambal]|uniref:Uncharacterized protein n=1 Tax=Pangasius djambal TaxID=1691987 RepID=A0ACC5YHM2_9TELE|nr:hypothetical protein [Pangasius djambal]
MLPAQGVIRGALGPVWCTSYRTSVIWVLDAVPIKKSKHDDFSHSPLADKDKKPDWLRSLSASANKGFNCVQPRQRVSAFRPWSPNITEKDGATKAASVPRDSFYNYKSLENSVAPNVALPPLQKGAPASLSVLSGASRGEERTEGHGKTRKRRITGEGHPGHAPSGHAQQSHALSRAPPPMTEERDSDVEVEVRDEVTSSLSSLSSPSFTSSSSAKELSSPGVTGVTGVAEVTAGSGSGAESQVGGASVDPELETLRQALDGGMESRESKEKLLHEILKMRVKQEEKLGSALQAKRSLQQIEELQMKLQLAEADREQLRSELQQEREARQHLERVVKDLQDQLWPKPEEETHTELSGKTPSAPSASNAKESDN